MPTTVVLSTAPRLAPLYVKAALGAALPGRTAGGLPDIELVHNDVQIDRDHLAEYARICGFALADTLPPTYPHVLGFPLQITLMADRAFPLSLPGLVHIRNTITMRRPTGADERITIRVHAERYAAHPRGARVDLVTQVLAGEEPVWDGRSTYLARGARAPSGREPEARPEPDAVDAAAAAVWQVEARTGRRYAMVSGDVNPIHLHPLAARAFGFRRTIAHGMWTAARALAALQGRLPDTGLTYDVVFGKPLLLPSTVELRTGRAGGGWDLDVRSARSEAIHLRAAVRPR